MWFQMQRSNGRVEPEERIDPVIRAEAQRRLRQRQGLPVEPEDGLVQDQMGGGRCWERKPKKRHENSEVEGKKSDYRFC